MLGSAPPFRGLTRQLLLPQAAIKQKPSSLTDDRISFDDLRIRVFVDCDITTDLFLFYQRVVRVLRALVLYLSLPLAKICI